MMTRAASDRHPVNGVLLLDKPVGITSNTAIQQAKRLLHAAKAGHVGTLDPLASGLLPVCFGEATKFSTSDKHYDADILLGTKTDTGDIEGSIIGRKISSVDAGQIESVLQTFVGNIAQTPPMYSAIKRKGRPLYSYARAGQTVEREPRRIVIHEIALLEFAGERLRISVHCGKGTYIRVLAEEIGDALGCGATIAGLRRTAVGAFDLTQSVSLERLAGMSEQERAKCLQPIDCLVRDFQELELEPDDCRRLQLGQSISWAGDVGMAGIVRLYGPDRYFLGIGEVVEGGILTPKRLVASVP
jgi:tRNA pseudouridine55 synthase